MVTMDVIGMDTTFSLSTTMLMNTYRSNNCIFKTCNSIYISVMWEAHWHRNVYTAFPAACVNAVNPMEK